MSTFRRLLKSLFARRKLTEHPTALVGEWMVVDISVSHPFVWYVIHLRPDGSFEWTAQVALKDSAHLDASGAGRWRASDDLLQYSSGDHEGSCRYSLEHEELMLDRLPATKIGPGVRCVLRRVEEPSRS